MNIRKGNINNLKDCLQSVENSKLGEVYYHDKEKITPIFSEYLQKGHIYVAEVKGKTAGYIWYDEIGVFSAFPYIRSFAIKSEFRGKGIGNQMLEFAEKKAKEKRNKIFLLVSDFNADAKRLYESRGYIPLTKIDDLFVAGVGEFIMMKNLD